MADFAVPGLLCLLITVAVYLPLTSCLPFEREAEADRHNVASTKSTSESRTSSEREAEADRHNVASTKSTSESRTSSGYWFGNFVPAIVWVACLILRTVCRCHWTSDSTYKSTGSTNYKRTLACRLCANLARSIDATVAAVLLFFYIYKTVLELLNIRLMDNIDDQNAYAINLASLIVLCLATMGTFIAIVSRSTAIPCRLRKCCSMNPEGEESEKHELRVVALTAARIRDDNDK